MRAVRFIRRQAGRMLLSSAGSIVLSYLLLGVWLALRSPATTDRDRPIDPQPASDGQSLASVPGASEGWWSQVSTDLDRREYEASSADAGAFQAPNRAQGFRVRFAPTGIEVTPRQSEAVLAWRFGWTTSGWGRRAAMHAVAGAAAPEANGARVTYRHASGLVEWYENTSAGLEQGFTIAERPAGDGALAIEGRLAPGLRPELRPDGAADLIEHTSGASVLRYGAPKVFDAAGRTISSWLEVTDEKLAIVVADAGADYPLTVDPLLNAPIWFGEPNQDEASYGAAVSTAGDVNGDGFSDILVAASYYDNGQENEGRVWLYLGSPAGPSNAPAWTSEGNQADASWGLSVGAAGDVNGDGFSDVIVGSPYYDNDQVDEGRAAVYLGSPGGLSGAPAWTAESNQVSAQLGQVATAGDVNGDGFSDVIVGAPSYDNGPAVGRAFAYLGSASGLATSPSWTAETNQPSIFGFSVGTAGDVNADGFSDVIVGAFFYKNGEDQEGGAFVYMGSAAGLQTTPAWIAESNQASARFGYSVGAAGDVNGDGYADVVVGAPLYDNGQSDEGRAFVYLGSATGLQTAVAWTAESNQSVAELGSSVATAGDVNGDGFADVLCGAHLYNNAQPDVGRVYLYEGSAAGLATIFAWFGESSQFGSDYGGAVATAGDVNGDGYSDILVGSRYASNPQFQEGLAYVYLGTPLGPALSAAWNGTVEQQAVHYGLSVASAGDVNGDGYSDVVVGAPYYDNGQSNEGRAYVYHGSATGLAFAPSWFVESNQAESQFGISVSGAGDVNGDGYSDVIVGAFLYDNEDNAEGRVFVYQGSPAGLGTAPAWTAESNQAISYYGAAVATAGDVNGDGYSDVIVGAINYDNDQVDEGRVFVYQGSAAGLGLAPAWTVESNQSTSYFGYSVASAGDVNGDGFSDVLVGSYTFDNGQNNEGRVFLYRGSATGLASVASWITESNQPEAFYGQSVASAGDVNGDGYSDIAVGCTWFDNDQLDEGRVFVYHGSFTGPSNVPSWIVESNAVFPGFGSSVASAGDVNGDGYSDLVIGAHLYSNPTVYEGRAFVYPGSPAGLSTQWIWNTEGNQDDSELGTSVASAGDVNGDGFADIVIGTPRYMDTFGTQGRASVFYGNQGDGLDRIPRQARVAGANPIALLGRSDSNSGFRVQALGRTPAGRGRVRLQAEVKPLGIPFNGLGLVTGALVNTGAAGASGSAIGLSELVSGLASETLHHWRLRVVTDSPFFPRSPWLSLPYNAPTEADLRTNGAAAGVDDQPAAAARPGFLEPNVPNPFASETEIPYALARGAKLRLAVYDVAGREVALLADGVQPAGRHTMRWNARDHSGRLVPAGVYFVRMEVAGSIESRKLVVTR